MKRLLALILLPIMTYAGSADAVVECKSGSGRTHLEFYDQDVMAMFTGGELRIDKKTIKYDGDYGHIVSDLKRGVYVVHYNNPKENTVLDFYAIPKTVQKTQLDNYETSYKFDGIIAEESTDPREKQKKLLYKTIWLSCTLKYTI